MLNIEIRRPATKDIRELNQFLRVVITDTFSKEGIGEMLEDIEEEIKIKKKYLNFDIERDGEKRYFLIALYEEEILNINFT
ncbi:hypothetical protein RRV45_04395 [Bacillus sp. DTU_2020_1000418_1_SI_GHA_SEK_038]|uniref:hypothetical protein n=1 Tax=Bacillus sp. DTU_2020_1000418_1_SI_GHA_SEK_038 TaxID=3077585 RepID=UPI0028E212E4|nr:hypothetical protein [Bacillus sp. DTU_2020_1000418_1_SI_GHA_SEK_038]WNS76254.1 hypothetical protein RRV45_04395 [Bacillus sp. DTU_2020_1000418_1_SI_GHA_SEK_038]